VGTRWTGARFLYIDGCCKSTINKTRFGDFMSQW
jgi:hypothetical protein